jgi:malic enzyme
VPIQSYDAAMDTKGNYTKGYRNLSPEQQKREKDRKEWARKVEEKRQERLKALKEQSHVARQPIEQTTQVAMEHQTMVEEMLKELYLRNPEWEARKKKVQRVSPD